MNIASVLLKVPTLFVLMAVPQLASAASAQVPVAVIEEMVGAPAGVQLMDYVDAGKVIKLGPRDSIVLGYLNSCARETIVGGTVTVGLEHSDVVGGSLQRAMVACQGGKMELTAETADKSAAMAFREMPKDTPKETMRPQLTVYGRSPVVEVKPIGALVIERLDKPGERHDVILPDAKLVHGKFLDLTTEDVVLAPGGIYRARVGMQSIIFKVDHEAQSGQTPIAGRLLRLQPAS
jgi:hypothetical protein